MMKKTLNVDAEYRRFKGMKAVESFCRKHNREEWIETFEWMHENGFSSSPTQCWPMVSTTKTGATHFTSKKKKISPTSQSLKEANFN